MKKTIRLTAIAAFTLIGTASLGQSLNFNGGFTASTFKMEGMTDVEKTESYGSSFYTYSHKYKNVNGYNFALGYEFKLGKRLSLETALNLILRTQ